MRYSTFDGNHHEQYDIAFLVPRLNDQEMLKHYIDPHKLDKSKVIAITLEQVGKKTSVKNQKEYLKILMPVLRDLKVKYLVVCDGDYFKTITKSSKAEAMLGYIADVTCDQAKEIGYQPKAVYCPNFSAIFYDPPKVTSKINQALTALSDDLSGGYQVPGTGIIHMGAFPTTVEAIKVWLQRLLDMNCDLTCDVEAFSLNPTRAGIGTISFAWNEHEGIAFPVDYKAFYEKDEEGNYGEFVINHEVRKLLIEFFKVFPNKMIYHNISFDATVLIYQLFMESIIDTKGLLDGIDVMLKNWDCTKLITYLAINSCAGNKLGLKDQAQEFAGNYAVEEIKDIRRIPLDKLLQYNLVDTLSTWFVRNKHWSTLVDDQQEDIYYKLFKPAIIDIVQMQLTGLPVDMKQVAKSKLALQADEANALKRIMSLHFVQEYITYRNEQWVIKRNQELKVKRVTIEDADEGFNPNSDPQLRVLLYDLLKLPQLDFTDSKLPATGGDTLKKLLNHTKEPDILTFLKALIDLKEVAIILSTFIPAFENAVLGPDGWHYLIGNFNLGGTKSGRLSSNGPNLQNIPATGSRYAKLIKLCIRAPEGWLYCGLDFNSLEDRISALTTKDPNKLKVYTDGYDGHCLRAYFYWKDQMPDIENTVKSINSIKKLYEALRQKSKNPTFALTYQGTYMTLMTNCGFPENEAREIEAKYHEAYHVSDKWVSDRLDIASKTGYVTVAFGLRLRTPLLKQVIRGTRSTPYEAQAEGRTAGNAMGQSYGLLNTRACIEFMEKVRASKYRYDIRICAQIHDASYYLVRNDLQTFLFLNTHLVSAAEWQDDPEIYHDEVKLGGNASVFFPNWAYDMTVPNKADETILLQTINEHITKLKEDKVL